MCRRLNDTSKKKKRKKRQKYSTLPLVPFFSGEFVIEKDVRGITRLANGNFLIKPDQYRFVKPRSCV